MGDVHGLVVEDDELHRRTIVSLPAKLTGNVKIVWDEAGTAAEAIPKVTPELKLVLADMCLGEHGNRDGLVVAFFAARTTNAAVFLHTGYELDAATQLQLHQFGIWPFTKAVDPPLLLTQIAKAAARDVPTRLPPSENLLELIATLMRMVDGGISDVGKWIIGIAAEQALEKTNGNKVKAGELLGQDRKLIDRALAWRSRIPQGPSLVKAADALPTKKKNSKP